MLKNLCLSRKTRIAISIFTCICSALFMTVFIAGVGVALYLATNYESKIDIDIFTKASRGGATKIYYYEMSDRQNCIGEAVELTEEQLSGSGNCIYVDYCAVPRDLIDAFVVIEDKRFWEHSGVDWRRTAHAVLDYLKNGVGNRKTRPKE